jgi:predicted transcriptional regulator
MDSQSKRNSRTTTGRRFSTLVEKGLVEKGEIDKRTNSYTVTNRGQRELEAREEWKRGYIEV